MRYFVLILCVLATSFGHILFKSTANLLKSQGFYWTLAFEPVFIGAVFVYGLATLGWIWCLQDIPVRPGLPFYVLGLCFYPLASLGLFWGSIKATELTEYFNDCDGDNVCFSLTWSF